MTNFATLKAKIADDITRDDLDEQIGEAIKEAIADYENERLWFNEVKDFTFSTVAGQADYDFVETADVADFIEIDWVRATVSGREVTLDRRQSMETLDWQIADDELTGSPSSYGYYASTLRIYPVPDDVYTVTMAGLVRRPELSGDDTSSNAWLTTKLAYELIRARAGARVLFRPCFAVQKAQALDAAAGSLLDKLKRGSAKRRSSRQIVPTRF